MSSSSQNLFSALRAAFPADLDQIAVEAASAAGAPLLYTWRDLDRASARIANLLASLKLRLLFPPLRRARLWSSLTGGFWSVARSTTATMTLQCFGSVPEIPYHRRLTKETDAVGKDCYGVSMTRKEKVIHFMEQQIPFNRFLGFKT